MSLYSQRVAQDSPLFYFENNSSGVNNTGSITPTIVTGSSTQFISTGGVSGTPYMYNAGRTGEYGFEYSNSSTIFNDREFSITGWFKVNSTDISSNPDYIFHAGTTANGIYLQKTDKLYVGASFGGSSVATSTAPSFDAWHHVAVTMDTTNLKLYVDGTLIQTVSSPASLSIDSLVKYWGRATTSGTPRNGVKGNLDEWAVFNTTLSSTTIGEHYVTGFGVLYNATPLTASALAVQPTTIIDSGYVAQAATASATLPEASWNFINFPLMLDTYMQTLSFEQWYKFDQNKKIRNYGTGGNAETAWAFNGSATTDILGGRQGSGALVFPGQQGNTVVLGFGVNQPYSTEITDNEFTIGFWFKAESGFGDKLPNIVYLQQIFSNNNYYLRIRNNGYVEWNMNGSQSHQVVHSTNVTDGNWHLIVVKASNSNNIISVNVDNGTAVSTSTSGTWPTVSSYTFNQVTNSGTNTKKAWISHYWVNGYSTPNSTQIGNMITYANTPIQGASIFPEPVLKFTNTYNDFIQANGSVIEFRMDEATDTPINYGTINTISIGKNGSNITYLQPTVNRYAYKFTNADTYLQGDWTAASGTFSTAAEQSVVVRFKSNGYKSFEQILGSTGMFGFIGTGITIALGANNGHISARLNRGFGPTDTETISWNTNLADNEWHLVVASKAGSKFTLFVDGKQRAQITNSAITPADSGTWGVAAESKYNGATTATKELYIDEFAVLSTEITAAEAFEMYQAISLDTDNEISALFVNPAYSAGYGPTVAAAPMIATAEEGAVFPFVVPLTGQALFQQPNFEAIKNTSNAANVMIASASFEQAGWFVGAIINPGHMDASATFPQPQLLIPGFWFDNPRIATAQMVQPTVVTTLGALIKPQSLNAKAVFQLPPAYYLITDDIWYQRLLDVDYQSDSYEGSITFFNTNNNIYLGGSFEDWTAEENRSPLQPNYGYNLYDSPLPVASAGSFDNQNRKTLNLKNIALINSGGSEYTLGWTLETMIRTSKKNQFIAGGYLVPTEGRKKRTGIRLNNGKIAFTNVKDYSLGNLNSKDSLAFTGFKDIADGNWHHVIIQFRDDDERIQVWIDGELDVQRYNYTSYIPNQIGFNSNDADAYSDFDISAISINKESFVLEREIKLNYFAAIGHIPFEATVATAEASITNGTRAKGNRARALMLYFWPTYSASRGDYNNYNPGTGAVGINPHNFDQGNNGDYDYDTFYKLSTYLKSSPEQFFDWDVFPVPVNRIYAGDTYVGDRNPLLNQSVKTKTNTVNGTVYVDPVTDNYRYLNIMEDIYELDQYDAIFFRNYPDQSFEQDLIGLNSKSTVDEYFRIQEKTLMEDFLKSLRDAVDTGISLFITNPQLAVDMKIIEAATPVPLLRNEGIFRSDEYSDERAPVLTGRVDESGVPIDTVNEFGAGWLDTWFNDRHRVVNTLEYLTDDNTFIWTDYAFYKNADEAEFGGPDRYYKRYENRPYGLQVGDTFVFADSGNPEYRLPYQAIKPEHLKAGIPITALSNKIWNNYHLPSDTSSSAIGKYQEVDNPYKDYITTVALPAGTELDGRLTKGKIFVSFSENVTQGGSLDSPAFNVRNAEYHDYDMASDYWINIAYNAGIIDSETRDSYINGTGAQPKTYEDLYQESNPDLYAIKSYWSFNGDNLYTRQVPVGNTLAGYIGGITGQINVSDQNKKRTRNGLNGLSQSVRLRDELGRFAGSSASSGGNFKVVLGRLYDAGVVFIPSINTRGLWWLSDKVRLTGLVVGAPAAKANASLPNPQVEAKFDNTVKAQEMIAIANIVETNFKGANISSLVLPMYSTALMVSAGPNIIATPFLASILIKDGKALARGATEDLILYLHHTDPTIYLRKDITR